MHFPGSSSAQKKVPKGPRVSALDKWIRVRNKKKVCCPAVVVVDDEDVQVGGLKVDEVKMVELYNDDCPALLERSWETDGGQLEETKTG